MEALLTRIRDTIERQHLLRKGDTVVVAISGGPDSVFLAWALRELGYEPGLAHVNYGLRGEASEAEEALVRKYADAWSLPLFVHKTETRQLLEGSSLSLQMLARQLRYDFFKELIEEQKYTRCATGHHAGDQAETILLSLIKINELEVLHRIPYQRGPYIRPLLDLRKEEILEALSQLGLEYGQDASNLTSDYPRNRIRNQVLPELEKINPAIASQLIERQVWYERQTAFMAVHLEEWYQRCVTYDPNRIWFQLQWDEFIRHYGEKFLDLMLVFTLKRWGLHGQALWEALRLSESQVGKEVVLQGKRITRTRGGLSCSPEDAGHTAPAPEVVIDRDELAAGQGACRVEVGERQVKLTLPWRAPVRLGKPDDFYLDGSKIVFPLCLRPWREGDRMVPFGMKKSKKLSDIFVDEKYTSEEKYRALVIEDAEKIIALSGFRIANSVKLDNETREVLRVVIE